MKESDELIDDAPWLADAINGRGMYQHELAVENYLVTALSGTSYTTFPNSANVA